MMNSKKWLMLNLGLKILSHFLVELKYSFYVCFCSSSLPNTGYKNRDYLNSTNKTIKFILTKTVNVKTLERKLFISLREYDKKLMDVEHYVDTSYISFRVYC